MSAELVVQIAKAESDAKYKEGKNNDTKYGKWYGLNNNPWCAMFVSWCFTQAGLAPLVAATTKKGFASCDYGMKWFAKKGQLIPIGKAQAGDIVFYQFDDDVQPDHVGIVAKNDGKGTIWAYEGNTAADGSGSQSNGDGVYFKKRPYKLVQAVARPAYGTVTPKPPKAPAKTVCDKCGK